MMPNQLEGAVHDTQFYFRARHGAYQLRLYRDPSKDGFLVEGPLNEGGILNDEESVEVCKKIINQFLDLGLPLQNGKSMWMEVEWKGKLFDPRHPVINISKADIGDTIVFACGGSLILRGYPKPVYENKCYILDVEGYDFNMGYSKDGKLFLYHEEKGDNEGGTLGVQALSHPFDIVDIIKKAPPKVTFKVVEKSRKKRRGSIN